MVNRGPFLVRSRIYVLARPGVVVGQARPMHPNQVHVVLVSQWVNHLFSTEGPHWGLATPAKSLRSPSHSTGLGVSQRLLPLYPRPHHDFSRRSTEEHIQKTCCSPTY